MSEFTEYKYGVQSDQQFLRVHLPPSCSADGPALPVAMVIHGGYWKNKYDIMNGASDTLAPALAAAGFATVDVEYRRRDHPGGGYPGTNADIAAAFAYIPTAMKKLGCTFDAGKVAVIGHSAGASMALWLAHHAQALRAGDPAAFVPTQVVALAPVTDMRRGFAENISDEGDAIPLYMKGTPDELSEAYTAASPIELLPLTIPTLVAYGLKDADVPPSQSISYCEVAAMSPGSPVTRLELPEADHFDVANAGGGFYKTTISQAWPTILARTKDAMGL